MAFRLAQPNGGFLVHSPNLYSLFVLISIMVVLGNLFVNSVGISPPCTKGVDVSSLAKLCKENMPLMSDRHQVTFQLL